MVMVIVHGDVIDHGRCVHCDQPIELFEPADGEAYWQHPNGPAGPGAAMTSGGISVWCRTTRATPAGPATESRNCLCAQRDELAEALWRWTHDYTPGGLSSLCVYVVGPGPMEYCSLPSDALIHDTPRRILARHR